MAASWDFFIFFFLFFVCSFVFVFLCQRERGKDIFRALATEYFVAPPEGRLLMSFQDAQTAWLG